MAVTAQDIIDGCDLYLPDSNVLDITQLTQIADDLILLYGDDDTNLGLLKCEYLKRVAKINRGKTLTDTAGLKREKLGTREMEYFSGQTSQDWDEFYNIVVNDYCPIFGISKTFNFGIKVNSSPQEYVIKDCSDYLQL